MDGLKSVVGVAGAIYTVVTRARARELDSITSSNYNNNNSTTSPVDPAFDRIALECWRKQEIPHIYKLKSLEQASGI